MGELCTLFSVYTSMIFLRASPGAASPLSFIVLSMFVGELSLKGRLEQVLAYLILGAHLKHLRTLEPPCSIQNSTNLETLELRLTGMAKTVSWRLPGSIMELSLDNFMNIVMT